ncbi:TetR family transcriptional regulator [Amycolatopsis sp. WAC 01375]|uniref:TetR/AcrR family transcriptional regulator n=1 Tax=unclassified Amycolatopsis TaxID=2618356 RepID=UPI000F77FBD3|nr:MULTISPECIES: TetR/AcrR family transcriptional regulator [unclassified Amycolatopsis]RSM75757.1 TetR family transcriptional regulator [Amycolatopsis sp. WAC 01375]RSN26224.1 TetR family transcriptional regulator [Amycolatopsis sp. WAC 01416]
MPSTDVTTRERLLTVAERMLLESGYDAVSVRAINSAAGMNPAAVHYHFGSKDALIAALLEARLAPMWQRRLDEITERRRGGWVPTAAELVDLVVTPLAELAADPVGQLRLRLLARFVLGRQEPTWTSRWFGLGPWIELLRDARPELSKAGAAHRWLLAFGLVLQFFAGEMPGEVPAGTLRAFLTAGLAGS